MTILGIPALAMLFIVASVAWAVLSQILSLRQVAHVKLHRDTVPADFAASVTPDEHRKAADYTIARERLTRFETLAELALSLVWAFGGISLVYGLVAAVIPPSIARGVAFLLATSVIGTLVALPFQLTRTFGIEQSFGFNRTTAQTFVLDKVKGTAVSLAVSIPLLFGLLWIMRTVSGLWWLWAWAGLLVLMVAAPTIYVRLIAPRFNRFEPLADGALRTRIEATLARSGFRSSGLFTMDASKRSAHGNAFFIGFGKTKRIVLFDTLIARCSPEEIEAVVAHELGHFRHGHIVFGLLRGAVLALVMLAAIGWLCKQPWLLPAFGVPVQDDALALFVSMLLASVVGPLAAPVGNWISRKNEFQADDYARRAVGVEPMISALSGLARDNASTLTPDPVYALVHYSHPTVPVRVRHLRDSESRDPSGLAAAL